MSRFRAEVLKQRDLRLNAGLLWVGDKPYPAWIERHGITDPIYHQVRRALLKTETPVQLSIIWGCATYSSNFMVSLPGYFQEEPETVEVGILNEDGLIGEPLGWQTDEQVLGLIGLAQEGRWPSGLA